MLDSTYIMPESSDIAMALISHKVLDIRRQNGKVVQCISLPKPLEFPACKENLGKMQGKVVAPVVRQDLEDSE